MDKDSIIEKQQQHCMSEIERCRFEIDMKYHEYFELIDRLKHLEEREKRC